MRPWLKYTIIRVGLFVVVFAITYPLFLASKIMSLQIAGFVAAVISAIVALCISYLGFAKLRNEVALELVERRAKPPVNPDEAAEDSLESDSPSQSKPE